MKAKRNFKGNNRNSKISVAKRGKLFLKSVMARSLESALKVNTNKLDKFIQQNSLLQLNTIEAIKKVWESKLTDNEVAYLLYAIGLSAASCDHEHEDEEDYGDDASGAVPEEARCNRCGVFESLCVCDQDKYID